MKAITLTQPWATLVAIGEKRYETRSWKTSHRGPIAIHAAKGLKRVGGNRGLADLCWSEPFATALDRHGFVGPPQLPQGEVVAVADLVACIPTRGDETFSRLQRAPVQPALHELAFGYYGPGRWAFALADIQPLARPVPCSGALSIWELPREVEEEVANA